LINPQEQYETIDNYLNDLMSEKERIDFEKKITQDETLAAKVDEVRDTNEAIYYASLAGLKLTIGNDIKKIKYKPGFNWWNAAYISITSVLVIAGITTTLVKENEIADTQKTESGYVIKDTLREKNTPIIGQPQKNVEKLPQTSILSNKTYDPIISDHKVSLESKGSDVPVQKNKEESKNTNQENKTLSIGNDNSIKKTEPISITETKTACDKSFKITSEASCKHQKTGSIVILTDHSKEYIFQINNHSTSSTGVFQNLPPGEYEVLVTYAKECAYTKSVTIGEKWCPMNSAYSFNPDDNEKWAITYEHGTSGRFTIFDTHGKEIYSSTFGSGNEQWNGTDLHGSVVQMGVYIAMISYSNGREERVELTIVR
jgi:hypothetical protein